MARSKEENSRLNINEEAFKIRELTLELLKQNYRQVDIAEKISKDLNLPYKRVLKHIHATYKTIKSNIFRDIEDVRTEILSSYIKDMEEAYDNYKKYSYHQNELAHTWFMTYLKIKNKIETFFPKLIEIPKEEDSKVITIEIV